MELKHFTISLLLFFSCILSFTNAIGQNVENKYTIPANLAIPLTLRHDISSKTLQEGSIIEFEIPQDIYFSQGSIPAGTKVFVEALKAKKRKCWGKAGKITLNVLYMQLGNQKIKLQAPYIEKEGISKKGKAWTWFWCGFLYIPLNIIPPLCIKGEEAILEAGTTAIAYTVIGE